MDIINPVNIFFGLMIFLVLLRTALQIHRVYHPVKD